MSTLSDLLAEHTDLSGAAVDRLQQVVGEWQLLADLSFADVLMWVRASRPAPAGEDTFFCVAQVRPTTASTAFPQDIVGVAATDSEHPQVRRAFREGHEVRPADARTHSGIPPRGEAFPARFDGEVIAVLSRDTNLAYRRPQSALEVAYLDAADDLCQMIADGTFPDPAVREQSSSTPRAGDGFIRLDLHGHVVYASPNALSAYHRMGLNADLVGRNLASVTGQLVTDRLEAIEAEQYIRGAFADEPGRPMEVEARGATVLLRALTLKPSGTIVGAIVVIRDVTEVKRRDRALLSKDATIREIHHRVKNNLQTVAALLRLQARRTENDEARHALTESVRRVTSIAFVHETLSGSVDEEVDLDDVIDRLVPTLVDVASADARITVARAGSIGVLGADRATPLVMVLTELVQNAIEHAFGPDAVGSVTIAATRSASRLDLVVHDDGAGLPEGFSVDASDRLGLQIVRTLVTAELGGTLAMHRGLGGGTDAVVSVPLGAGRREGADAKAP